LCSLFIFILVIHTYICITHCYSPTIQQRLSHAYLVHSGADFKLNVKAVISFAGIKNVTMSRFCVAWPGLAWLGRSGQRWHTQPLQRQIITKDYHLFRERMHYNVDLFTTRRTAVFVTVTVSCTGVRRHQRRIPQSIVRTDGILLRHYSTFITGTGRGHCRSGQT
jgi:hypothetical protein